jgi:hypothetical protein
MPVEPECSDRDEIADAAARRWAEETRRQGDVGEFADDSKYLARKLAEEKLKLKRG